MNFAIIETNAYAQLWYNVEFIFWEISDLCVFKAATVAVW